MSKEKHNPNYFDGIIEINELPEDKMAGRVKIRMSAHKIVDKQSLETANENGICWLEEYVQENIDTCIGMPYVVDWMYSKEEGIPSGHGTMKYTDDGEIVFEGESIGSVQNAFIEDIEIDGEIKKVLMTEGYIYEQRNKPLVEFLKSQKEEGNKIYGSIEINGKNGSKIIEYLDGNKNIDGSLKMDRVPIKYSYSGLALLYIDPPADRNSQIFEVNSKQENLDINTNINNTTVKEDDNLGEENNQNNTTIEINELNIDDLSILIEREFNKKINEDNDNYKYYYIHKFYPTNSSFVMKSWYEVGEYYKSSYIVENSKVTIGNIVKVEEDWMPVDGEKSIEINNVLINILNNQNKQITKEENNKMDEKIVLELNQKIEDKINEINTLTKSLEAKEVEVNTLIKSLEEKTVEINTLTEKSQELDNKIIELNTTIVEVNKLLESEKTEKESLIVEVNSFREEKTKLESEAKIAEVNAYFETEITKNGFEEAEVNSLKSFVDAVDLDGLKKAEAELCAKKFKEMIAKDASVEVNTKNDMFIAIKEKEKKVIPGSVPSFFN